MFDKTACLNLGCIVIGSFLIGFGLGSVVGVGVFFVAFALMPSLR